MTPDVIAVHLQEIKDQLGRILAQAEKTNGRVSTLEMWRARVEGAFNGGRVMIAVISALAGIAGALIGAHFPK